MLRQELVQSVRISVTAQIALLSSLATSFTSPSPQPRHQAQTICSLALPFFKFTITFAFISLFSLQKTLLEKQRAKETAAVGLDSQVTVVPLGPFEDPWLFFLTVGSQVAIFQTSFHKQSNLSKRPWLAAHRIRSLLCTDCSSDNAASPGATSAWAGYSSFLVTMVHTCAVTDVSCTIHWLTQGFCSQSEILSACSLCLYFLRVFILSHIYRAFVKFILLLKIYYYHRQTNAQLGDAKNQISWVILIRPP